MAFLLDSALAIPKLTWKAERKRKKKPLPSAGSLPQIPATLKVEPAKDRNCTLVSHMDSKGPRIHASSAASQNAHEEAKQLGCKLAFQHEKFSAMA